MMKFLSLASAGSPSEAGAIRTRQATEGMSGMVQGKLPSLLVLDANVTQEVPPLVE